MFIFFIKTLLLLSKEPANNKMERLDRTQWKQYQLVMQDAVKFVEMLHDTNLEDGLFLDVNQGIFFVY